MCVCVWGGGGGGLPHIISEASLGRGNVIEYRTLFIHDSFCQNYTNTFGLVLLCTFLIIISIILYYVQTATKLPYNNFWAISV